MDRSMQRDPLRAQSANQRLQEMEPAELKQNMLSAMRDTGILGNVKTQLRSQLLTQLQRGQILKLAPPPGDKPNLKRRALNNMICGYLIAAQYKYSLSVFGEESGASVLTALTDDEMLDVLHIDKGSLLHSALVKARADAGSGPHSSFLMGLIEAVITTTTVKERANATSTQTGGGDRYTLDTRMKQVESQFEAKLQAERLKPSIGVEERMATYRAEIEEQAKAEIARQVERIREVEIAGVRLEEAVKHRKQTESERVELERMHNQRLAKLRHREEEMMDKLRRQQRDVENVAFEHRQKILREEERLRNWRAEVQQALDAKEEQVRNMERSAELREHAVSQREIAAEKRHAEATEMAANAKTSARHDVEHEYVNMKAALNSQRMQLEMDRARIMELRSEAAAEIAAARSKEDRIRAQETARAEAEARAAAHAADAEIMRLQVEKLSHELMHVRDELSRRVSLATDSADAMLQNAAGALKMLDTESLSAANVQLQIAAARAEGDARLEATKGEVLKAETALQKVLREKEELKEELKRCLAQVDASDAKTQAFESLCEEAIASREQFVRALDESSFVESQLRRDLEDLQSTVKKCKEEIMHLKTQLVAAGTGQSGTGGPGSVTPSARLSTHTLGLASMANPWGARTGAGPASTILSSAIHSPVPSRHISPRSIRAPPTSTYTAMPSATRMGMGGFASGFWGVSQPGRGPGSTRGPGSVTGLDYPPASRPKSPSAERLESLSRQEREMGDELSEFRKRVAIQREAGARDLGIAKQQVLSRTNSNRSSRNDLTAAEDDPDAELRGLRHSLSISLNQNQPSAAGMALPDGVDFSRPASSTQQQFLQPEAWRQQQPHQQSTPWQQQQQPHQQVAPRQQQQQSQLQAAPWQQQQQQQQPGAQGQQAPAVVQMSTLQQLPSSGFPPQQQPLQQQQPQPQQPPQQQRQQQPQVGTGLDAFNAPHVPFDGSISLSDIPNIIPPTQQPLHLPQTVPESSPAPAKGLGPPGGGPAAGEGDQASQGRTKPPPGLVVLGSPADLSRSHSVTDVQGTVSASGFVSVPEVSRAGSVSGAAQSPIQLQSSASGSVGGSNAVSPPPGLSLVPSLSPRDSRSGPTLRADQAKPGDPGGGKGKDASDEDFEGQSRTRAPSAAGFVNSPSVQDVEGAMQARMRMLKEQTSLRISQQKEAEEERVRQEAYTAPDSPGSSSSRTSGSAERQSSKARHQKQRSDDGSLGPAYSLGGSSASAAGLVEKAAKTVPPPVTLEESSDYSVEEEYEVETPAAAGGDAGVEDLDLDDDLDLEELEAYNISVTEEDGLLGGSVEDDMEVQSFGSGSGSVF